MRVVHRQLSIPELVDAQMCVYGWTLEFSTQVAWLIREGTPPATAFEQAVGDGERPYDPFVPKALRS